MDKKDTISNKYDMLQNQLPKTLQEQEHYNEMLSNLLNDMPGGVGIFTYSDKLECKYFSDGFAKLSGRSRQEIIDLFKSGNFIKQVVVPADFEFFLKKARAGIKEHKPIEITYRYFCKDGEIAWLHLSAKKIAEENNIPVYYCIFTVPSDEQTTYKEIVDNSSTGIFVASREKRKVLFFNDALFRVFSSYGSSRQYMEKNIQLSKVFSKDLWLLSKEQIKELKNDEFSEFHLVWKEKLHLSIKAKAINWHGIDSYILYFNDETAQFNQQREQEHLINLVPTGIGIYEVKNGKASLVFINEAYYSLLGATREERKNFTGHNFMDVIHPDDKDLVSSALLQIIAGKNDVSCIYRAKNGKGEWQYLKLTGQVVERKTDYIKIYVSFADCDEMIKAQHELEKSRSRLHATLDTVNVLEWSYDYKRQIVTNSGSLGRQFKWPEIIENIPQVLQGLEHLKHIHPDSVADVQWLFEHCGDGQKIQRDIQYRESKSTRYLWIRIIFTPITDKNGITDEVLGTAVDITEQKDRELNYEEQLRIREKISLDSVASATYNLTKNLVMNIHWDSALEYKFENTTSADSVLKTVIDKFEDVNLDDFESTASCEGLLKIYSNGVRHVEVRHRIINKEKWFLTTMDIMPNPFSGDIEAHAVIHDITERALTEFIVERLVENYYEQIILIDSETGIGRIFNQGNKALFATEIDKSQNSNFTAYKDANEFFTYFEQILEKENENENINIIEENRVEVVVKKLEEMPFYETSYFAIENGVKKRFRSMYTYLENNKRIILCTVQDITEAFEKEEIQKTELSNALKEAQIASRSKTDFLSRMSHDMRTPMNGILGLAQLATEENNVSVLKDLISQIKDSGDYLLRLINDTLDFQRIESGKFSINKEIVFIDTWFNSLIDLIKPAVTSKNIEFKIENETAEMGWYVTMDPLRTTQIFMNLISNAIKFTPKGGQITLSIECLGRDGFVSHDCIRVADSGMGMSKEFIENRLFKPFEQEQNVVSSQYAGSGLGLSIIKNLVEMMGGHIEVESAPNKGTVFSVYLDFYRVDKDNAQKRFEKQDIVNASIDEKLLDLNILLVEDHPLNAKIAITLLEKKGCNVTWVDNGQKGVDAFKSSEKNYFDVILMDIRMPIMNGIEATIKIRDLNCPYSAIIPIIAMTANAFDEDIKACLNAGMTAHLSKPIEPEKLYETIAKNAGRNTKRTK